MGQGLIRPASRSYQRCHWLWVQADPDRRRGEIPDPWARLRGLPLEQIQQVNLEARGQMRIKDHT